MADLKALRAELKDWERTFRSGHGGRNPTKDDVKNVPEISAKYKLWRSLSKGDAVRNLGTSSPKDSVSGSKNIRPPAPSTSSMIKSIHKSHAEESPSKFSTSTVNPFSPKKSVITGSASSRRTRAITPDDDDDDEMSGMIMHRVKPSISKLSVNPFLVSPTRSVAPHQSSIFSVEKKSSSRNSMSPPSSPRIPPSFPVPSVAPPASPSPQKRHSHLASLASTLTPRTKARKRMRGEEVPLTPEVNKRQRRIVSSVSSVSYTQDEDTNQRHLPNGYEDMDEDEQDEDEDILLDSPVKQPTLGSSMSKGLFQPIFDDSAKVPTPIFASAPSKRSMATATISSSLRQPSASTDRGALTVKRGRGQFEDVDMPLPPLASHAHDLSPRSQLRPPTPPPVKPNIKAQRAKNKGKGVPRSDPRKKPKLTVDESNGTMDVSTGSTDSDNEDDVTIIKWRTYGPHMIDEPSTSTNEPLRGDTNEYEDDLDRELWFQYRTRDASPVPEDSAEGNVRIDLPDEMLQVLDLDASPTHSRRPGEEQIIVQDLLSGRRNTLEESRRVGPVWGPGEWGAPDDEEDDWESETEGWKGPAEL